MTDNSDPFHAANIAYDAGQNDGYMNGYSDAIEAAVQRIENLQWSSETWDAHAERAAIIAAIKGDQP